RQQQAAEPRSGLHPAAVAARAGRWVGRHRERARRDGQLPEALERLAASLRAGQAPGAALAGLAAETADPLGRDLRAVARRLQGGMGVEMALEGWRRDVGASDDVRLVVAVLTLGAGAGGEIARAVDGVAATLRERRELAAEVQGLATQARASAAVLATAPLGFTALVATIEPAVVSFLCTNPVGVACLALGGGLLGVGAAWMGRIVRSPL
ncbi:MAG: type II secretion system F family protein, partial [Acidimicrobiales bacterium]